MISLASLLFVAQTLVFTAPADTSNVSSYVVEFWTEGTDLSTCFAATFIGTRGICPTALKTVNIGKPTPVAGDVSVDLAPLATGIKGPYFVTVKSINAEWPDTRRELSNLVNTGIIIDVPTGIATNIRVIIR